MPRLSGERLGESNVWKTKGGAVPSITDIYSLVAAVPQPIIDIISTENKIKQNPVLYQSGERGRPKKRAMEELIGMRG